MSAFWGSSSHGVSWRGPDDTYACRNTVFRKPKHFILDSRHVCPLLQRKTMSSKALVHISIFERIIWGQRQPVLCSWFVQKFKRPKRIVSQQECFTSVPSALPLHHWSGHPIAHRLYCSSFLSGLPSPSSQSPTPCWTSPVHQIWLGHPLLKPTHCLLTVCGERPSSLVWQYGVLQAAPADPCSLRGGQHFRGVTSLSAQVTLPVWPQFLHQ